MVNGLMVARRTGIVRVAADACLPRIDSRRLGRRNNQPCRG